MPLDFNQLLLAAIDALTAEIKAMRADMKEAVGSTKTLQALRDRKANEMARWREKRAVVGSTKSLRPQVVEDRDLDHVGKKKKHLAPVGSTKTLQTAAEPPPTREAWTAYAEAYVLRYGVKPEWSARTGGQLAGMITRIPKADCADVARFYLSHNKRQYIDKQHSVGLMVADCEGLRTQMLAGKRVSGTDAAQADRTQSNLDGWADTARQMIEKTHGMV